jgi:hypothetical protein
MSLEHVGAAATAGLAAGAIERPTGKAGEAHTHCADCGAELVGRFCHNCGQPAHIHRSLLHLGEELLHGVMHFDGRIWRTMPMLVFRPGTLTRNWVHGKRSRYVSPLAIFLFTVFVLFMVLSYMGHGGETNLKTLSQARADAAAAVQTQAASVKKAEAAVAAAPAADRADAQDDLKDARKALTDAQDQQAVLDGLAAKGITDWKGAMAGKSGGQLGFSTGSHWLDKRIAKVSDNPQYAFYKLQQSFYKFSFLLVPLSIPFVALLFLWKRGYTLYDHGVFILYSITFVSLMFMLAAVAGRIGKPLGDLAVLAVIFGVPVHMFFQLKGAYSLKTFSALWRTFVLLNFCSIVLGLFASAVVALTFA